MEEQSAKSLRKDRARKSAWPSIILGIVFWLLLLLMVIFVDPATVADFGIYQSYALFFILVWLAVFYTASLLWQSKRRGLLTAMGVTVFLFLRLKGIGTGLNFVLLFLLLLSLEWYIASRRS